MAFPSSLWYPTWATIADLPWGSSSGGNTVYGMGYSPILKALIASGPTNGDGLCLSHDGRDWFNFPGTINTGSSSNARMSGVVCDNYRTTIAHGNQTAFLIAPDLVGGRIMDLDGNNIVTGAFLPQGPNGAGIWVFMQSLEMWWRSTDGASTWTQYTQSMTGFLFTRSCIAHPDFGFFVCGSYNQLLFFSDDGITWRSIMASNSPKNACVYTGEYIVAISESNYATRISKASGFTSVESSPMVPTGTLGSSTWVGLHYVQIGVNSWALMATNSNDQITYSLDHGATWSGVKDYVPNSHNNTTSSAYNSDRREIVNGSNTSNPTVLTTELPWADPEPPANIDFVEKNMYAELGAPPRHPTGSKQIVTLQYAVDRRDRDNSAFHYTGGYYPGPGRTTEIATPHAVQTINRFRTPPVEAIFLSNNHMWYWENSRGWSNRDGNIPSTGTFSTSTGTSVGAFLNGYYFANSGTTKGPYRSLSGLSAWTDCTDSSVISFNTTSITFIRRPDGSPLFATRSSGYVFVNASEDCSGPWVSKGQALALWGSGQLRSFRGSTPCFVMASNTLVAVSEDGSGWSDVFSIPDPQPNSWSMSVYAPVAKRMFVLPYVSGDANTVGRSLYISEPDDITTWTAQANPLKYRAIALLPETDLFPEMIALFPAAQNPNPAPRVRTTDESDPTQREKGTGLPNTYTLYDVGAVIPTTRSGNIFLSAYSGTTRIVYQSVYPFTAYTPKTFSGDSDTSIAPGIIVNREQ